MKPTVFHLYKSLPPKIINAWDRSQVFRSQAFLSSQCDSILTGWKPVEVIGEVHFFMNLCGAQNSSG